MTPSGGSGGRLVVVGTGIRLVSQVTQETAAYLEKADHLLYLVADKVTEHWLRGLNPTAETLYDCYAPGKPRWAAYREMVERILGHVRRKKLVVVAFYGHPGVFVNPGHVAIRQAREEGFEATMLPGVSAEDCLFADLGIDPAAVGCASFEATDFLVYGRRFDTSSHLILWQVGVVGEITYRRDRATEDKGLRILAETLLRHYPPDHQVVLYGAAQYPVCDPIIHRVTLAELLQAEVPSLATLYVPPLEVRQPDREMLERLGLGALSGGRDESDTRPPLGSRIAARFAGSGLPEDVPELRGEQARPADFET